ncbi:MAG TPA: FtsX-like permease family protein, partial [Vicinamibacterales bacterium]|nr:FtsX-like permease family protein [Vicinamibacterales bacterium]
IVESMLLASAGGLIGFAVAEGGVAVLEQLAPTMFPTLQSVSIDARTLAVMAGLVLATGVVLGLVPAVQAARIDVRPALVDGGSRVIAGGARHWLRRGLVMAEVALGATLLVLTVLLLRTVVNVNQVSPGFEPQRLVTASVSLQDARYQTAEAVNRLFDESLRELHAMPDVESAGVSLQVPYTRLLNWGVRFMDDPDLGIAIANVSYVTPGFIETLRIPVLHGRAILARDQADAPPVVLVNETFARLYGQDGTPMVGRLVALSGYDVPREVIGIVGDVQQTDSGFRFEGRIEGPLMATPTVLIPAAQLPASFFNAVHTWFRPIWTVRPRTGSGAASAVTRAVARSDPLLPVSPDSSVEAVIAQATSVERLLTRLVGSLAVAAVLLAALGIYGLIAQSVVERRREIAIRLALGATPVRTAAGTVLAGAALAATGTIGGLVISIWGVGLVRGFLWGVDEHDPLTYVTVMAFFVLLAALASLLPSIRLLRLDPADALRD